jgi:hypothetical protein
MKYAVKFFLDTDGFTNWDDDQIEDPDITFTIVRFPSIEEAKKAVNQDFIDFRDDPGFYSNDTVRSCNGRWLVANDMKMFGGTAVPGEEEGFAVSYEVSGDCDYASMIIESVSPASEEDETHMESDLEEGCIEGVFICEDSHCNTEQSQKYTDTDSDPFLGGRSLDNYLSDCNELGLLPAIDDIYERYGADGLEKAASMVRLTYYNDEMVSTIPNYLEAGYDLEKIKEYALISPSIAYELQSYIATINDNDEEAVTIAGRYCESGDILIENIKLPKLTAGDVLCVYNTGAYNYSMASNYNRVEKPAMVLVNSAQSDMIVNRESLEDLIARENIPDRLKSLC